MADASGIDRHSTLEPNKQNEGLTMGASAFAFLFATFAPYIEHKKLIKISNEHHIIDCDRYLDDIFNIYNTHTTNTEYTVMKLNSGHSQFRPTKERGTQQSKLFVCNIRKKHGQLTKNNVGSYKSHT
jgi:hypothetical protein